MFFVLFLNMKHGKQNVSSSLVGPSCDTQNLVLSELSLLNPSQNFENKIQGLQYIGARLQYIGARLQYIGAPKFYFQHFGRE